MPEQTELLQTIHDAGFVIQELIGTTSDLKGKFSKFVAFMAQPQPLSFDRFEQIVKDPNTHLYVMWRDGAIVATLTRVDTYIPTHVSSRIECVRVSPNYRGLMLDVALLAYAEAQAPEEVGSFYAAAGFLTPANALYTTTGYERQNTLTLRKQRTKVPHPVG